MIVGFKAKRFGLPWKGSRKRAGAPVEESTVQEEREVNKSMVKGMDNAFLKSIVVEEDPFEGEAPESVKVYDIFGNEIDN